MKKTITLLTILMLVVFMVGCEKSMNPIQSQGQNDNDGISLGKRGGTPGPPDKGGAQEANFTVQFFDNVFSDPHSWTKDVSSGATSISTGYGNNITLDISGLFELTPICFGNGVIEGILMIGESNKKDSDKGEAYAGFWFFANGEDGTTEVKYILEMWGTFDDGWQANADGTYNIALSQWEMTTESNKNKNVCKSGLAPFSATLVVTVDMILP